MSKEIEAVSANDVAVVSYGNSLIEVIARAASDPNVDVEKMERLFDMQERVRAREAETSFNQAMNAAQSEMRSVAANASNPQTKSRYATFDKLDKMMRPIYTHHGFSLSFDEADSDKPDYVRVVCYVSHVDGHTRTYHRDMPADGKGAKGGDVMTKTHAAGAAGSYGARYLLKGIFNIAVGEDDNDGNGPVYEMPAEAFAKITQLIEATDSNVTKMFSTLGIEAANLRELTETDYNRCVDALNSKLAKMAKAETDAKAAANG